MLTQQPLQPQRQMQSQQPLGTPPYQQFGTSNQTVRITPDSLVAEFADFSRADRHG
jgi:hypothetical protein